VEDVSDMNNFRCEFWEESIKTSDLYIDTTEDRFRRVVEDDLILSSPQGTLCLRFLVDLVDEEKSQRKDFKMNYFGMKEGALLWCQTLSHLCGPQQLKQKLPHFGADAERELQDFVEIRDDRENSPQLFKTIIEKLRLN
jgi:hypothetical protein